MKVIVNGNEESESYCGNTLDEFLEDVVQKKSLDGFTATRIRVNESDLPVDADTTYETPVPEIRLLEVDFSSFSDIIEKNIVNAENYLKKLLPAIKTTSDLFRSGSEQEASAIFVNMIDGIGWLSEVVEMAAQAVYGDNYSKKFNGKSIQARQGDLVKLIEQMVEANQGKDWVLAADLLEYELLPYYNDWVNILPQLRQEGNKICETS